MVPMNREPLTHSRPSIALRAARDSGPSRVWCAALAVALVLALGSCSPSKFAANQIGNSIAKSGDVFTSDDDPELVRDAIPFGLKTMESLLRENPRHLGLLLAAC